MVREAAKKSYLLYGRAIKALTPPPPELNGSRNFFSLKIAETDFYNFFPPNNFWTKTAIFFAKYCNKPNTTILPTLSVLIIF